MAHRAGRDRSWSRPRMRQACPEAARNWSFRSGVFSPREALSYLIGRLTADTDQRLGRHRPGRGPGLRAVGARPGQRGHREFRAVLPGLPGLLRPPPDSTGRGCRRAAACRRGHLDLLLRAGRTAVARRRGPGAAGTFRTARRPRDPRRGVHRAGGMRIRRRRRGRGHRRPGPCPERAAHPRAGGPAVHGPRGHPGDGPDGPLVQTAVRAAMPPAMFERAALAAADALRRCGPPRSSDAWVAASLRSCAASLQRAAGDLLWAGGCHPLLVRAGQSLDSALHDRPRGRLLERDRHRPATGSSGRATRTRSWPASGWPTRT